MSIQPVIFKTNPFLTLEKEKVPFLMCITGASGSGKTRTALEIARRIAEADGKPIALLDSEGKNSLIERRRFDFGILPLMGQYAPNLYVGAIEAAARFGYGVLVIDSLSAAWNQRGGVLEIVDSSRKGRNQWSGWAEGRPQQNALVTALVNSPVPIIATMRAKTDWLVSDDGKPVKVGIAPVQSEDMEFEFQIGAHLDMQHNLTITKSRFDEMYPYGAVLEKGQYDKFVADILAWCDGVDPDTIPWSQAEQQMFWTYWTSPEQALTKADLFAALGIQNGLGEWTKSRKAADRAVNAYVTRATAQPNSSDGTAAQQEPVSA